MRLAKCVLPLLLLSACSSPDYRTHDYLYDYYYRQALERLRAPEPIPAPTEVWEPDRVAAYSVGRAVDPRDPDVVHEAHTIYRREETSHPNLTPPFANATPPAVAAPAPAAPVTSPAVPPPPPAAPAPPPAATNLNTMLRDALTAEVNQQRATSQALIQEAHALNERLRELNGRSEDVRNSFEDSARLRAQLQAVTNRLAVIESQLPTVPAAPANRTSPRP